MDYKEPPTRKATNSEVATTLLITAMYLGGNIESVISFVRGTVMPKMLSKSRFNRRMHAIGGLLANLFFQIGQTLKQLTINSTYSINVVVFHNIRIKRSRLCKGEDYRRYCASKRCYFYGFKIHMIVTTDGIPVEYSFTKGSVHDLDGLRQLPIDLPNGSCLLANNAYTDYAWEQMLADNGIRLLAARKGNSKDPHQPWINYLISTGRKRIETTLVILVKLCLKDSFRD